MLFTPSEIPFLFLDNSVHRLVAYNTVSISATLQLQKILPPGSVYKMIIGPFSFLEFIGAGVHLSDVLSKLEPRNLKSNEILKPNLISEWKRLQHEALALLKSKVQILNEKISDQKQRILQPYIKVEVDLWEVELHDPLLVKFCASIAWDRLTRPVKLELKDEDALRWAEELVEISIKYSVNGQHYPIAGISDTLMQTKRRRNFLHTLETENPVTHINYQGHHYDNHKDLCDIEFTDFLLSGFSYYGVRKSIIVLKNPICNPMDQTLARLQGLKWLFRHMEKKTGTNLSIKSSRLLDFDVKNKKLVVSEPSFFSVL